MGTSRDLKILTTTVMTEEPSERLELLKAVGLVRLHPWGREVGPDAVSVSGPVRVGRGPDCELTILDTSVSREHAVVTPAGDELRIEDKRSRNGTFVDDAPLDGAALARPGQLVRFGRCTFLVVDAIGRFSAWWQLGSAGPIIGGPSMGEVRQLVEHFGPLPSPVLLLGESGTGKEVVANAIHRASKRPGRLVAINCAAVPETMFEDQFFGHKKGAFTGATCDEAGFLRAAEGGTVLLDEVGELAPDSQAKLLRALEASEVIPLGASAPVRIDVRVIAATNRDLAVAVSSGAFRGDLYSRIRVLSIPLPPLRDRPEDVALLSSHFMADLPVREIRHDAFASLLRHDWPGNVRELRNALVEAAARAVADDARVILPTHLRPEIAGPSQASEAPAVARGPSRDADAAERVTAVLDAMRRHQGNVSKVASELGLHRQQVYNALYSTGLAPESFRAK
jgi:DNA-binding NtrC family response regulator